MRLPPFEHLEPETAAEACALLSEPGVAAAVMAGGTDLLVRMKHGVARPPRVVSLSRVAELRKIREVAGGLAIGACVTLTEVRKAPGVRESYPVLAEAALAVGAAQLQNMGTLGGNLCLEPRCWYFQQTPAWRAARPACLKNGGAACYMAKAAKRCYALYCGDTAAALLALGARVRLAGPAPADETTLPLEAFFVDDGLRHTVLQPGRIVAEVILPAPAKGEKGTYVKFRKRGTVDFPIVGVAAVLRPGAEARVGLTGVASAPLLAAPGGGPAPDGLLDPEWAGDVAANAARQIRPVSRMEVSPAYRRRLVEVLTRDALERLAGGSS